MTPDMGWYVLDALFGFLLLGFAGWLKQVAKDAKEAKDEALALKIKVAEEYATKELVDKMENRVIRALAEFKMDLKEELKRLFSLAGEHHSHHQ